MNSVEGHLLGMRCLQCGKKLGLLRKIANGEFCSAEHRGLYRSNECQLALVRLKESQVRIERPTAAEIKASMAAVERLRAMDSSAADPTFVETFPIVESVRPRNQRRMAAPAISLEFGERLAAVPDRPEHRESLSFVKAGPFNGVVEPEPLLIPAQPRTLALRPLFRLGVRLLASGAVRRMGQMRYAGLCGLTAPRPILRPGYIPGIPADCANWMLAGDAAPSLPARSEARTWLAEPPMAAGSILPVPVRIGRPELAMQAVLSALPCLDWSPLESMRAATRAAVLREIAVSGAPIPEPEQDPAPMQPPEPVALRSAVCAASTRHISSTALEGTHRASLPDPGAALATLPRLKTCDSQEPVRLCPAATLPAAIKIVRPVAADPAGLLPALKIAATPRMRSDEAMQALELRASAQVPGVRSIAAVAAAGSTNTALPTPLTLHGNRVAMRRSDRLLPVEWPSAEPGRIVGREVDSRAALSLDPALPAHEAVHTTLLGMREETGLQVLSFPANATSVPLGAGLMPLALAAAASAGGPALPEFRAPAEPMVWLPLTPDPILSPSVAAGESAEPGEPIPPVMDRQLPLAMGRALNDGAQAQRTPIDGLSPAWDASICCPPATPQAVFTVDHADGSGSRQDRTAVPRSHRNLIHSIDLRSLPGRKFWKYAPADLKWVALGLPLILVFVIYSFRGSQPKAEAVPVAAGSQAMTEAPASTLNSLAVSLKNVLVNRAAVNLLDDFRGGLGAWQGGEGWAKTWRYGQATFLEPGNLALYKPSLALRDYSLEFLGQIQGRSLNWVFRAKDERNYYAMRILVTRPGPMPEAQIVQYAVINGKEERPKVMPTPYPVRPDTMYLVRVDVRGSDFSVQLQGQPLYNFSDGRLQEGGVGFFGPKGDKSYLRWVQVKHQYDYIGRLCALLAPYSVTPETAKSE